MFEDGSLIQLQTCQMTQLTTKGIPADWIIVENMSHDRLATLPASISDRDMFAFMDMAREYELKAFNAGIDFQKTKGNQLLIEQIRQLELQLKAREKHGDKLADKLNTLLGSQENEA